MTKPPGRSGWRRGRHNAWLGAADTSLRASPLRTLLSTLGVVIGVASLVAILALSTGLEEFSRRHVEDDRRVASVGRSLARRLGRTCRFQVASHKRRAAQARRRSSCSSWAWDPSPESRCWWVASAS